MFKKGDFVIYETMGVCQVVDVNTVEMKGIDRNKLFYYLEPLGVKDNRLYIPVENHKSLMRSLLSKEEASALLEQVQSVGALWVSDYKHREENYKEALKSCDCREWMKIINTLYHRKAERTAHGKKLPAMDSHYLKLAEECLYTELALVLGTSEEDVGHMVSEKMQLQEKVSGTAGLGKRRKALAAEAEK